MGAPASIGNDGTGFRPANMGTYVVSSTRAHVAELHRAGRSPSVIARQLGLATNTVRYHLKRLRDPPAAPMALVTPLEPVVAQVRTRAAVARLLDEGCSRVEIASRLGVANSTVSYHARRLGRSIDARCARRYDWAVVQAFHDTGASVRDCVAAFAFSRQSWHAAVKRGDITPRPAAMPLSELLVADTYRGREHLKRRLLAAGLKQSSCEHCGLTEWLGRPVSLALHHVNGDRIDNRLENLELLCPNCHSQTNTFAGRNR